MNEKKRYREKEDKKKLLMIKKPTNVGVSLKFKDSLSLRLQQQYQVIMML